MVSLDHNQGNEFLCRALPGCITESSLYLGPQCVALSELVLYHHLQQASGLPDSIGWCVGEPWPEFEDYREHLDDKPWIEENIEQILSSPFWHSDEH